jgi:serine/threonine protein kinase
MRIAIAHLAGLSSEEVVELDRLIERFEDAWRRGERPAIGDYLPAGEVFRHAALCELAHTDMEYRWRAGEAVGADDYLQQFSDLADDRATARELARSEDELRREATATRPGPARLGRFLLLDVLGSGSCGVVYRAVDTQLERTVAVKVLHAGQLAGAAEKERFLREARSAAMLRHPGLVAVHDAGECEGMCFLVSEFVPGETLAERLKLGQPSFPESADLLIQVAQALHHAHQQGVIHRDLKPANILLHRSTGCQPVAGSQAGSLCYEPKITDFGLARRDAGDSTLTVDGQVLGTPAYMSPEQARGQGHCVDARSDVYSLGVILYQLLTGELPFQGTSRMVLAQVLEDEPRPPRRLADDVPRDLEIICLKALAREPGSRYQTAAAFADDLRRFREGRPILARPIGPLDRAWRWCRRRPVIASLIAALLLVTLLGLTGVTWQWRQAENALAEARRQRSRSIERFRRTRLALNDMVRLPSFGRAEYAPVQQELLEKAIRYYREFIAQHPEDDPDVRGDLAAAHFFVGHFTLDLRKGSVEEAHSALSRACSLWENLPLGESTILDRDGFGRACYRLGDCCAKKRDPAGALHYYDRACRQFEELLRQDPTSRDYAATLINLHVNRLGVIHLESGQTAEAIAVTRQACLLGQRWMRDHPDDAEMALRLADASLKHAEALLAGQRRAEARAVLARAVAPCDRFRARNSRSVPWLERLAGFSYRQATLLDRADLDQEALRAFEGTVGLFEDLLRSRPGHLPYRRAVAASYHCMGRIYAGLGKPARAIETFQRSIAVREAICRDCPANPQHHSDLAGTRRRLALAQEQLRAAASAR